MVAIFGDYHMDSISEQVKKKQKKALRIALYYTSSINFESTQRTYSLCNVFLSYVRFFKNLFLRLKKH